MDIDFNRAFLLLSIADKARQWPQLKKLEDAAMAELLALQEPKAPKKPAPILEAERKL